MLKKMVVVLGMVALGFAATACGSSDQSDCVGSCQAAKDRNCTSITQDCSQLCSAMLSIASKGGCGSQKDAYVGCLTTGDVCDTDARCASQSSAFGTCAGIYCITHATDPDCQSLVP